jgi:lipid II:glycine glycyltransferase (peptidoglycan interpeptide bridge formation enzyme)
MDSLMYSSVPPNMSSHPFISLKKCAEYSLPRYSLREGKEQRTESKKLRLKRKANKVSIDVGAGSLLILPDSSVYYVITDDTKPALATQ